MDRCQSQIKLAQAVMEVKQERDKVNESSYTMEPSEFFSKRLVSVEDALKIERANLCMKKCQEPVDVLKRVISANLKEININIQ